MVVNEAFARTRFPNGRAVGRQLRLGVSPDAAAVEIVGVVSDPGVTVDDGRRAPSIFVPLSQGTPEALLVAMRTHAGAGAALGIMLRELGAVDAALPLGRVRTLAEVVRRENDGARTFGTLFAFFGAASLMLAAVGLHGLVAFTVSRRRREIGIMRALGARGSGVLRSTLGRGLTPVAIGLVLGSGVAFMLAPLIGEGLFGADPHDPLVFVLVPIALLMAAALAVLGPARRALRLDPMYALRAE
jgi:putative ABC transport system permease protein